MSQQIISEQVNQQNGNESGNRDDDPYKNIDPERYVKILNSKMRHREFQYHEGLNEDINKFDPNQSCTQGGLYYTKFKNWIEYILFGGDFKDAKMAFVTIPDEVQQISVDTKFKSPKIILSNIVTISKNKWILLDYINNNFHGHLDTLDLDTLEEDLLEFLLNNMVINEKSLYFLENNSSYNLSSETKEKIRKEKEKRQEEERKRQEEERKKKYY